MKTKSPLKRIAMAAAAVTLVAGPIGATAAYADPPGRHYDRNDRNDYRNDRNDHRNDRGDWRRDNDRHHGWQRGQRLGAYERQHYSRVDYRRSHLRAPPRGYHYVRDDRGDTLLVGIATGVILGVILNQ